MYVYRLRNILQIIYILHNVNNKHNYTTKLNIDAIFSTDNDNFIKSQMYKIISNRIL